MERLYREVGPQLLAYLRRRHPSRQTAEDLLQETFAAVMRRPDGLRNSISPRAYLFGVARNLSAVVHRRFHASEELPVEGPAEPDAPAADPRLDAVREAIMKLNPAMREVLELRLQLELSYEEVADVLGIPVGTVRSRLHQAVKQLRRTVLRVKPERENNEDCGT